MCMRFALNLCDLRPPHRRVAGTCCHVAQSLRRSVAPSLSAPMPIEPATWLTMDGRTKKVIPKMTNKRAKRDLVQTVEVQFVIPAGKIIMAGWLTGKLIMKIRIPTRPQTQIAMRKPVPPKRIIITTRQFTPKHTIITTLPSHPTHLPSHLPMDQLWLLSTNCLPHHHTSLLETTIIPIICDTDLILQIHLLMRIRRKSQKQVRNKRNQLRSLTVPAAAPSKASPPPLLLLFQRCRPTFNEQSASHAASPRPQACLRASY